MASGSKGGKPAKKKPAAKKPAAKKAAGKPAKKPARKSTKKPAPHGTRTRYVNEGCRCPRCKKANRDYAKKRRGRGDKLAEKVPKGAKLNSAELAVRDTLIVTRRAQGWSFEAIAKEVKLSRTATETAYERKRASMTSLLELDAKKILEGLIEGLQFSVGDLEQLAVAALEERNVSAAVQAKKAANEAREKLQDLLQTTGILPNDLGTIRHQIEFHVVVVEVVNLVHAFVGKIEAIDLPADVKPKVLGAADELRTGLESLDGGQPAPTDGGSDGPEGTPTPAGAGTAGG
jgi:hypothetical protein